VKRAYVWLWGLIRKSQAQGRSKTASSSLLSTGLRLVGTCFRRGFWSRKWLLPATLLPFVSLSVLGPVSGRVPSLCTTSRASSLGTYFASLVKKKKEFLQLDGGTFRLWFGLCLSNWSRTKDPSLITAGHPEKMKSHSGTRQNTLMMVGRKRGCRFGRRIWLYGIPRL
jgi:hypothetical protein